MSDELYSLEVCAKKAGVSLSTIKRDIMEGKLTPTRIRGCVKIHPQDWGRYIEQCRSAGMARVGKSESAGSNPKSANLSEVIGMLPNLNAALTKGSRIIALDERRPTRSKKRLTAG